MISLMSIVTFLLLATLNCIKCNPVDPNANGHSNGQQASENSLIMENLRRYLNQVDEETQNSGIMRFGRSGRSQLRHGSPSDESASDGSASDESVSRDSVSQDFEFIRKDVSRNLGVKSRMEKSEKASYSSVIVPNDNRETFSEVGGQSPDLLSSDHFVKRDDVFLNDSINPVSYDLYDRIMFLKSLMKRQQAGKKPMKPDLLPSTHVQAM